VLGTTATVAEIILYARRSTTRPDATAALVSEINSTLLGGAGADEALRLIARRLTELTPASCVLILRTNGAASARRPRSAACAGTGVEELLGLRTAIEDSCVAAVLSTGDPVVIDDLHAHLGVAAGTFGPSAAVPLRAGSRVLGVLLATRTKRDRAFTPDQLSELSRLAHHAAIALELGERHEERRWSDLLDDRYRIAQDMYHLVIRRLVDAGMRLQPTVKLISDRWASGRVETVISQLDDVARQMRDSIFDIQVTDHGNGLRQRLLDLVVEAVEGTDMVLMVRIPHTVDHLVPDELAEDIEAVVREATVNVVRHANATELTVTVEATDELIVCVVDDGVGFADSPVRGGLRDLEQRAARHDGTMSIGSEASGGTRLIWQAPLLRPPESTADVPMF
jgi:signal transduction histidine kinase